MGRDKVLGLSLAILVIGIGGAFCFRNEQVVRDGLQLARAKLLDEVIAQRPGPKPYAADAKSEPGKLALPTVTLQGIESLDSPSRQIAQTKPPERSPANALQSPRDKDNAPAGEVVVDVDDSEMRSSSRSGTPREECRWSTPAETVTAPPEIDIRPAPARRNDLPTASIGGNVLWQQAADRHEHESTAATASPDPEPKAAAVVHRVHRGDTLSRIAQQYLGDGSRYFEIFAANREQLQTPDDRLYIGMILRIPRAKSTTAGIRGARKLVPYRSAAYTHSSGRTNATPPASASPPKETPSDMPVDETCPAPSREEPGGSQSGEHFTPVRRSPFLPSNSESSSLDQSRGRRLSQQPPTNDPGADTFRDEQSAAGRHDLSRYQYFPKHPTQVALTPAVIDETVWR